jgi:hypothetical protein
MKKMIIGIAMVASFAACNNNSKTTADLKQEAYKQIRDSLRLDSFERAEAKEREIAEEKERILALQKAQPVRERVVYASNSAPRRRTYVKGVSETYTYQQPTRKQGWSHAAKGAAIGAGAGAVTGILVDKKDARGAVVGGLIGAGTGYVIGRAKDRRTGRIQ